MGLYEEIKALGFSTWDSKGIKVYWKVIRAWENIGGYNFCLAVKFFNPDELGLFYNPIILNFDNTEAVCFYKISATNIDNIADYIAKRIPLDTSNFLKRKILDN